MERSTTAERLAQLMKERGLRQVDIIQAAKPYCARYGINLGKNDVSQYVSGKVVPGQEKLTILGLALNVSEAWLMGFNVPQERMTEVPTADNSDGLDPLDIQLYEMIRTLTRDEKQMILAQLQGLLARREGQ